MYNEFGRKFYQEDKIVLTILVCVYIYIYIYIHTNQKMRINWFEQYKDISCDWGSIK